MQQVIRVRIHQRLPACINDIGADADGAEQFARPIRPLSPRLDHHADPGRRLVAAVDHPHLVVHQMHGADLRHVPDQSLAQSPIQRVDRAITLRDCVLNVGCHVYLHRRLGDGRVAGVLQHHDPVVVEREILFIPPYLLPQQQFKTPLGRLELIPGILQFLHLLQHSLEHHLVAAQMKLLICLGGDIALAAHLADQDSPGVADLFRIDVLIASDILLHRMHVHAAFVGEGGRPDIRLIDHRVQIRDLIDITADFRDPLQRPRPQAVQLVLQLQIGDQGQQVHVPAALAESIDRPLGMIGAGADARQCIGGSQSGVVMGVDADRDADGFSHGRYRLGDKLRHAAAISVAQRQHIRPGLLRGLQRPQGIVFVVAIGVEEMLRVIDYLPPSRVHQPDRVGNHLQIFFECHAQHHLCLAPAGLADDGHYRRLGLQQGFHARVLVGRDAATPGHPERRHLGSQLHGPDIPEECLILGIGKGESTFDVIDAQVIQLLGNHQFVLQREIKALSLSAVAQSRVVDFDASGRAHSGSSCLDASSA